MNTTLDNELADFAKIAYDLAKQELDSEKSSAWCNNLKDLVSQAKERQLVSAGSGRSGHDSKIHGFNGSAPNAKGKGNYASVETWTDPSRPATKVEVPIIGIQNVEIKPRMIHYTKVPCNIRVQHDKLQNQLDLADAHDIAEEEREQVREIVVNSEKEYLQDVESSKMMQVDEQLKDDQLFEAFVNVMLHFEFERKRANQFKRSHGGSRNKPEAGVKDVDESSVFHAIARFAPNLGFPFELRERYLRLTKSGESSKPSIPLHELKREDVMKPFHKNFCRRCFVYNCLLHDEIEKVGIERVRRAPEETDFSEDIFQPCSELCYKHLTRNKIGGPALPLPDPHAEQCPSSGGAVELDSSDAGNSSNGYESMLVDRNDDSDGINGDSDESIKVIKVLAASKNNSNQMPENDTVLPKRTTDKRARFPTSESYFADIENQHNSKHGSPSRKLSQNNLVAEKYYDAGNSSNHCEPGLVDRADDSDGSTGDSDDSIKVIKVLSASKNNSNQKPLNSTVLPKLPKNKRAKGINDSAISCENHKYPSDSADIENQCNSKNGSPSRKLSESSLDEVSRSIFGADMEVEETEGKDASKCQEESWNYSEVSMYLAMQTLWPNRYCSMARAIRTKSCQEVYQRSQSDEHKVTQPVNHQSPGARFEEKKRTKKRDGMAQLKAFRQHCIKTNMILAKSKKPEVHPAYVPCHHPGLKCEEANNCCCIIHKIPCEKFCSCTVDCVNLYPGCQCKGSCDSKHCDCVVGNRECDMDMCGCNLHKVLENPKNPCKNVNIQNRLEKKVKHMPSKVAGLGLFAAEPIKMNEYIGEYVGELISTSESELRGEIYDRMKSTFLFSKDDLTTIDGMRFGNSLRFINSSSSKNSANCFPVSTVVYGNLRIAFYASKNIAEDEELFFDYDNVINQQMGGNSSTAAAASTSPTKRAAKKSSSKIVPVSTSTKEISSEKVGRFQSQSDDSDSDFV